MRRDPPKFLSVRLVAAVCALSGAVRTTVGDDRPEGGTGGRCRWGGDNTRVRTTELGCRAQMCRRATVVDSPTVRWADPIGATVEFRVLGPVSAWRDGGEVPLDGAKQRTVLAVLLLARGRTVSDTRLCQLLWDENPPATFAAQLYNYVSRLRKYLGDEVEIVRQWSGYLLRMRDSRLDIEEFERLAGLGRDALRSGRHEEAARDLHEALALWSGATLSNVTDHLIEAESPRMAEVRMAALEDRITADLMLGRQADLVVELSDLVAAQPLHELLRSHLMTALLRCDRQADALAVYHQGRRVLADELGADPGPALAEAYQTVLAGPGTPDAAVAPRRRTGLARRPTGDAAARGAGLLRPEAGAAGAGRAARRDVAVRSAADAADRDGRRRQVGAGAAGRAPVQQRLPGRAALRRPRRHPGQRHRPGRRAGLVPPEPRQCRGGHPEAPRRTRVPLPQPVGRPAGPGGARQLCQAIRRSARCCPATRPVG